MAIVYAGRANDDARGLSSSTQHTALAIRLKKNEMLAAAPAPGHADNVFDTAARTHRRRSLITVPSYVDRRPARGPGTAAAAAATSDGMLGRGLDVPRALRARRAASRVRRVHLRHRDMARLVRAVRLLPRPGQPLVGHRHLRGRSTGSHFHDIIHFYTTRAAKPRPQSAYLRRHRPYFCRCLGCTFDIVSDR